ncbi:PsbP-related protein [Inediibacterium massiliense]|uniref:PsbP-related protein n=1 Tax=Inediibacterium massiliense TaxID=1658111 RepID=UPI0006B601D2|nr:PsbP-related protein [Inediibacterium massiliense]
MKKNVCKVVVYVVALVLVMSLFAGCSSNESKEATSKNAVEQNNESNTQTEETGYKSITSTDKTCEISIPKSWSELEDINEDAIIQVASEQQDDCTIVISDSKTDFAETMTIEDYMNEVVGNLFEETSNIEKSDIKDVTINGQKAKQIEVTEEEDKIKTVYMITIVETDKNYYQVLTCTSPSRLKDNRDGLEKITNSFKEN